MRGHQRIARRRRCRCVTSACTCGGGGGRHQGRVGLVHVPGDLVALGERGERGLGEVEAGEDDGTLSHVCSMHAADGVVNVLYAAIHAAKNRLGKERHAVQGAPHDPPSCVSNRPKRSMKIAILKERRPHETRVAATPETVKKLKALGVEEIVIEAGRGHRGVLHRPGLCRCRCNDRAGCRRRRCRRPTSSSRSSGRCRRPRASTRSACCARARC